MQGRTALLIRCSKEEAELIRREARHEYRTMSSYVLNILQRVLKMEDRLFTKLARPQGMNRVLARTPVRPPGPRTAILLRCSTVEAEDIRHAARRREIPVSSFVMHALRRCWTAAQSVPRA